MAPQDKSSLGELEQAVMNVLWDGSPLPTRGVHDLVGRPRGLAYTTILTILQRLHRKGFASRIEAGRGHVYSAALTRDDFAERQGRRLAATLLDLGETGLAAFLVEARKLDPAAVASLRRRLEKDAP